MKRLFFPFACVIMLGFMSSGCSLLRKPSIGGVSGSLPADEVRISEQGGVPVEFNYLTYSASVSFITRDNELALEGEIRMVRDSLIWISLRKFGFEAARVMLSKDSVLLIDRINGRYFAGDYKFFTQQYKLDADFNLVEAILLANPLENWSNDHLFAGCSGKICRIKYSNRYRINQGSGMPEGSGITDQEVLYSETNGRLLQNTIRIPAQGRSISAIYNGWKYMDGKSFPENTEITLSDSTNVTVLKIRSSGHSLGNTPSFPFKIPAGYKPLM